MSSGPKITIEEGMMESTLPLFGFTVDDNGIIYDQDNVACRDELGLIPPEEVAGIVKNIEGEPELLRDNFSMIVEYVTWKSNLEEQGVEL